MKRVLVLQARMGSSRLPGKVLKPLAGRPMIVQQVARLRTCRELDAIVVATSCMPLDDQLVEVLSGEGIDYFRGEEDDVLARFVQAAHHARADLIVRATADCPLIDPGVVDRVVQTLQQQASYLDYASNVVRRTFPRGLDVEAFFPDTLERMARMATSKPAREHVTYHLLHEQPSRFVLGSVEDAVDHSHLRWTVDTPEDLELVERIYAETGAGDRVIGYTEVLAHVHQFPELMTINEHVHQRD